MFQIQKNKEYKKLMKIKKSMKNKNLKMHERAKK